MATLSEGAGVRQSCLKSVPCVQITTENIGLWWNSLLECVERSHVVAIDLELTGLGDRQKLNAKKIDERYESIQAAAQTRSIVSIGLAFFQFFDVHSEEEVNRAKNIGSDAVSEAEIQSNELSQVEHIKDVKSTSPYEDMNRFEALDRALSESADEFSTLGAELPKCGTNETKQWSLSAKLFNMLCLCEQEYVCEPETMRFLAGHGFDFNAQCLHGLPYKRGNDIESCDRTKPTLRNLINGIIRQKLPIVLHNGFIDLIYFYHNFYAELPNDLQTFVADLADLFPSGVYDTKYIADFHDRLDRSYLEYLFYERQRRNIERTMKGQPNIALAFPLGSTAALDYDRIEFKDLSTNLFNEADSLVDICYDYANHGWCRQNHSCPRSHNIDLILDKKKNKNKALKKLMKSMKKFGSASGEQTTVAPKQGVHRAGYDAFMTGYCLAFYIAVNAKCRPVTGRCLSAKALGISHAVNNIYLSGKDQSLRITASSFTKPSINHTNKIKTIRCKS